MPTTIADIMRSARGSSNTQTISGVAVAIVTNNQDPDGVGRVKVKFPWLADDLESSWARVSTPMSGQKEWGVQFIPEVDDEVLVAFEFGDVNRPVVVGSLYNGVDKPALTNSDGKNNIRQIKTRSGHILIFDDTDGSEKITIRDKTEKQEIVFDAASKKITIKSDDKIELEATNEINLKSKKIVLKSDMELSLDTMKLQAKASGQMNLEASGVASVKGSILNLN
jgi:uncharacterized protein involved in type VI secretion and phage assembly